MDSFDKEKIVLRLKDIVRFTLDVIAEIEAPEKQPTEKEMNAILKEKAEKKKSEPKSEERKYNVSPKHCKYCDGLVSWDGFVKGSGMHPKHVNQDGTLLGDGKCPKYGGD